MSARVPRSLAGFSLAVVLFLLLAGTAISKPSVSPNLVKNGGFEQPVVGAGGYKLVSAGQSFAGWKVVGAAGNVAPISGDYKQNGIDFVAKAGKQWLDLTGGSSNQHIGGAQTVKTTPGASYRFSFAVGNVVDRAGVFGTSSTVEVLVNGHKLLAATNKTGGKTQTWKTFTLSVKASSAATTIEFLNGDSGSDNDNGLDAVSLIKH